MPGHVTPARNARATATVVALAWPTSPSWHCAADQPGERIETLEGPASAARGYWIVKGQGEMWRVSADEFARRHR